MQVSQPNNVKIYNLSAGKSLPEWLSERKRRMLQKNDIDLRRRVELIQDFEMPTASSCIRVSPDKQFIMAAGVYKPKLRCYETSQLSMKFERCLDSEIVKFQILSEDYSKIAFLNFDRHVEFHAQYGRYYRTRIPKFGRDLVYHYPTCELYLVGVSSEVYRLNLEQGRFLNSLQTDASSINACSINPVHHLFAAGTAEGCVECWDPRSRSRVGILDLGLCKFSHEKLNAVPAVTALSFNGALAMGVGTNTGHVLLYDLRSSQPLLVKDHQYGLPIKSLAFQKQLGVVLSVDNKILKIWDKDSGKPLTSIEPQTDINDLCLFDDSGLLFLATESPKMLIYYIPSLGPAPRWCSFLDNLTEELEEDQQPTVYDDYKFVTKEDLDSLGLSHLVGTNLLRAYMHGYFVDIRLYHKKSEEVFETYSASVVSGIFYLKARSIAEPFAYEEYRKKRIQEKLDQERENRVKLKKLPKINRNLAEKLLEESAVTDKKKTKKKESDPSNPLGDNRFAAMFTNPDFQVDEESEEFKLLHPVLSKHDKERQRRKKEKQDEREQILAKFREIEGEELEGRPSEEESSSDDDETWKMARKESNKESIKSKGKESQPNKPKFFELKSGETLESKIKMQPKDFKKTKRNQPITAEHLALENGMYPIDSLPDKNQYCAVETSQSTKRAATSLTLGDRVRQEEQVGAIRSSGASVGEKEITFTVRKSESETKLLEEARSHQQERKRLRRSAASILPKPKRGPVFWRGKRVR